MLISDYKHKVPSLYTDLQWTIFVVLYSENRQDKNCFRPEMFQHLIELHQSRLQQLNITSVHQKLVKRRKQTSYTRRNKRSRTKTSSNTAYTCTHTKEKRGGKLVSVKHVKK